jgi:hypothetical protein
LLGSAVATPPLLLLLADLLLTAYLRQLHHPQEVVSIMLPAAIKNTSLFKFWFAL